MSQERSLSRENLLLKALPSEEAERLWPHLERRPLAVRDKLYVTDRPIEAVYFPLVGVGSVITDNEAGGTLEVATVGNEGMVGLPLFLGSDTSPMDAFIQVPGEGLRLEARAFKEAVDALPTFRSTLQRYTQAMFVQISQNAACLGSHPIEQRCARWLLMTHDRVGGLTFELTHDFLAQMLGVRRAGVSEVMGRLQDRGLIEYARGEVTVLDRPGLDAASCRCYRLIRREYERLLGSY